MKNKQHGFVGIILVIVIALGLVGGGAYIMNKKKVGSQAAMQNSGRAGGSGAVNVYTNGIQTDAVADADVGVGNVNVNTNVSVGGNPIINASQTISKARAIVNGRPETYIGASYGFSHPADWSVWEANRLIGLTILYPAAKEQQVRDKTISTSDEITISIGDGMVNTTGATTVVLGGQTWYMESLGKTDGSTEATIVYSRMYNGTKSVHMSTGVSNKAVIESVAASFIAG